MEMKMDANLQSETLVLGLAVAVDPDTITREEMDLIRAHRIRKAAEAAYLRGWEDALKAVDTELRLQAMVGAARHLEVITLNPPGLV